MATYYVSGQTFDKIEFTEKQLTAGEYENCRFLHCNLANVDLSDAKFLECEFIGCNVSLAKLSKTAFREVVFKECKMLGLHFHNCNPLGLSVSFDQCNLTHASFYATKLKKTIFKNSKLHEVNFTESDLTECVFENCDFAGAIFDHTIVEKADLRTSFHYSINPEINKVKKAKFALSGVAGLLEKYDIEIDRFQ